LQTGYKHAWGPVKAPRLYAAFPHSDAKLPASSSTPRSGSSVGARRRVPARASTEVPRYFETTAVGAFRQYTVKEMVDCTPWKDKRDGKGDRFDEHELREKWHTSYV
jgi:hypothetical protein